mmetsp:Transcript_25042/g.38726  ORF Transcript_25042/g.38726 Transcript_25042/m.38726 type:complete len:399 (-) Transcript_25042:4250-5446(-)
MDVQSDECIENNESEGEHEYMIMLFYIYTVIEGVADNITFQKNLCEELFLKGRIRVSIEGLNVVLSGTKSNLQCYENRLLAHLNGTVTSQDLDVKYCPLRSDIPASKQLFDYLSIKETKDLVSLEDQLGDEETNAFKPAPHLSPKEWHEALQSATTEDSIIIDARNVYESKIGYFTTPFQDGCGAPTLLTNTRRYSQLPPILKESIHHLAGKNIYMYCTGGVRCEKVSQYVQKLANSDDWIGEKPKVFQLKGGIQRYLETYGHVEADNVGDESSDQIMHKSDCNFSQSCLFQGKNFVFDQRRFDPQLGVGTVGACNMCSAPHSDYDNGHSPSENREARCYRCRILVLICSSCREKVVCAGEELSQGKIRVFCGPSGTQCINEGNDFHFELKRHVRIIP